LSTEAFVSLGARITGGYIIIRI